MADLTVPAAAAILAATRPAPASAGAARFILVGTDAAAAAAALVAALPGAKAAPFSANAPGEWLLCLPDHAFADAPAAFDAAAAIRRHHGLNVVEPDIVEAVMPAEPGAATEEGLIDLGCWVDHDDRIDADPDWALDRMRVPAAWVFAAAAGRPAQGEGIVIAQIDTGITAHPELAGVDYAAQLNLLGDSPPGTATDPLDYSGNPGHGTGTASVVVSPAGGHVTGSAPRARHLPIRAIESVVRISQLRVAEAIDAAVDRGADIISMSLGGLYSIALERAVDRAVARNVIIVAAAGNCVRIVVWPARFARVIAIGGTNYDDRTWQGSSRGLDVDLSAPAENVVRAVSTPEIAGQGQGTSFATALTAGVAACWLAYHGRAAVVAAAAARNETAQALFQRLAMATARPGPDWDRLSYGAGIVDAAALLAADFDLARDTESAPMPAGPDASVRTLALEKLGPAVLAPGFDWQQHGAEISRLLLAPPDTEAAVELSASLAESAPAGLLAAFGAATATAPPLAAPAFEPPLAAPAFEPPLAAFGSPPLAAFGSPPLAAPAIHRPAPDGLRADPAVSRRQRAMIAAIATPFQGDGDRLESVLSAEASFDAPLPATDDLLARIDGILHRLPEADADDPDFRTALAIFHRHAETGLAKLGADGLLTANEGAAMEAIVHADGSRPSLLLTDGKPPLDHPLLGVWADRVAATWPTVQKVARAVGRIQPVGGHASRYFGTGTLVDAGAGLVLTNYHVLDDARRQGVPMTMNGTALTIHEGLEIDFIGESGRAETNRFRVIGAQLPAGAGRGLGALDAAILRIAPIDAQSVWPDPVPRLSDDVDYAAGAVNSLATIGFPGPPERTSGTVDGVDWSWVTMTLFGKKFGLKRLAPGAFWQALGSHPDDTATRLAFGHDATTFGGASGSLVIAWTDADAPAFGLHFAGATRTSNYAVAFAAASAALKAAGLSF